jgi:integrase/recombinase XerD
MRVRAAKVNALPRPAVPVMFALHEWVKLLRGLGWAEETIRGHAYGVFRLFLEEESLTELADVTPGHLAGFLGGVGRRSSMRTRYAWAFRTFFGFCVRRGYIDADPTLEIRVRKPKHRPAVVLSEEELTRICIAAAWRHPRRAWALILMFSIGCRRGELAGIAPRDVMGDDVLLRWTKGGRQRRVPLNDLARTALQELEPWHTDESVLGGVNAQTVTEWASEAARDAGLAERVAGRPSHVLRASFATHLLRRGVPIEVVRDLLGHESIATTNSYAVSDPSEREKAVSRLPFVGERQERRS